MIFYVERDLTSKLCHLFLDKNNILIRNIIKVDTNLQYLYKIFIMYEFLKEKIININNLEEII